MKDRIRKVMESQHMTQQVFAEFIQIAPATLSSIFTGRTRPTLAIVEAIKNKIPKISTDWLLFGIGDMYEDGSGEDVSVKAQSDSGTVSERMLDFDDHQQVISSKPSPVSGVQFSYDDVINKVKNFDKPQRKITEIRIFYDDQTWETFVPKK
ncbi:MAG: transcriptional regulator [Prevotella sp. AG:487_50_53]|nr:MAG: transcriptional regulator [Prevotella sp. AG:487_50_53]CCZ15703.1 putative uncharacterized protein [Prevotella sp. CAG:487]